MKPMLCISLALLVACHHGPDTTHLENDVLHLEAKISLPGVSGRIDHLAYDPAGHRLFVAALGKAALWVYTVGHLTPSANSSPDSQ